MIQNLRKLAIRLTATGTIERISAPFTLYKDSYGFIGMQLYVPITPNDTEAPLCTVFCTTINAAGDIVQSDKNHNMPYAFDAELDGFMHRVFERPMPEEFTATVGELWITYNYMDTRIGEDGERYAMNILTTGTYETRVTGGGWNRAEISLNIPSQEAAKINANTAAVRDIKRQIIADEKIRDNLVLDVHEAEDKQGIVIQYFGFNKPDKRINIQGVGGGGEVGYTRMATWNGTIDASAWSAVVEGGQIRYYRYIVWSAAHGQMVDGADPKFFRIGATVDRGIETVNAIIDWYPDADGNVEFRVNRPVDTHVTIWNGRGIQGEPGASKLDTAPFTATNWLTSTAGNRIYGHYYREVYIPPGTRILAVYDSNGSPSGFWVGSYIYSNVAFAGTVVFG